MNSSRSFDPLITGGGLVGAGLAGDLPQLTLKGG